MDNNSDKTLIDDFLDCTEAMSKAKAHSALLGLLSAAISEDITLRQAMQKYEVVFHTETFAENGDFYLQAERKKRTPPVPPMAKKLYDKMVKHILEILNNA